MSIQTRRYNPEENLISDLLTGGCQSGAVRYEYAAALCSAETAIVVLPESDGGAYVPAFAVAAHAAKITGTEKVT